VSAILDQLGLDYTFFIHLGLFAFLFLVLANVYFKPFLELFQARHKRTVKDREAAEKLMEQADAKLQEFKHRLAQERAAARKEYERLLSEAKFEEEQMLSKAWSQAKKITQEAAESAAKQRDYVKEQIAKDVEHLATTIAERLVEKSPTMTTTKGERR